jgi:hypothetical protein
MISEILLKIRVDLHGYLRLGLEPCLFRELQIALNLTENLEWVKTVWAVQSLQRAWRILEATFHSWATFSQIDRQNNRLPPSMDRCPLHYDEQHCFFAGWDKHLTIHNIDLCHRTRRMFLDSKAPSSRVLIVQDQALVKEYHSRPVLLLCGYHAFLFLCA